MALTSFILTVVGVGAVVLMLKGDVRKTPRVAQKSSAGVLVARAGTRSSFQGVVTGKRAETSQSKSTGVKKMKAEEENEAYLKDVLMKNGEDHLYDCILQLAEHAELDPPVIFGWENGEEFVRAIQVFGAKPGAPDPPFQLPVSFHQLKKAVLTFARADGAPEPQGTTALPCSMAQCCVCIAKLTKLQLHPWTQYVLNQGVVVLPLANIYIPRPRSNKLDVAVERIPNSLWYG